MRGDQAIARLMEAEAAGDLGTVEALARGLGVHPELRAWTTYVIAGCRAVRGEPAAAYRLLAAADERGEWWGPGLLADPSLASVWPLDRSGIRERSERRRHAAQERARVTWETVPARTGPAAVIIALHGNCPAPVAHVRPLWAGLGSCTTYLVRSSQVAAAGLVDWRDRERAIEDVRAVRAAVPPGPPVLLAGLGAGGRIAIDAATTQDLGVAGVLAFAPRLDAPAGRLERGEARVRATPRIQIFPGGDERAVRSCDRYAASAAAHGISCALRREDGMGHAYPARFGAAVAPAVEELLA